MTVDQHKEGRHQAGQHERFRQMIDQRLAGSLSRKKEESLEGHLAWCGPCQDYLQASERVVTGLRGFAFEVDETLNTRVLAALISSGSQRQTMRIGRRQWAIITAAAGVLTAAGSAIDLEGGRLIAPLLHVRTSQVQQGIIAFWIVPSFCVLLLFPLLPLLSKSGLARRGLLP